MNSKVFIIIQARKSSHCFSLFSKAKEAPGLTREKKSSSRFQLNQYWTSIRQQS